MALQPEFEEFYDGWSRKVEAYHGKEIRDYFDKFLTQYVIYNRLYVEATKQLSCDPNSGIRIDGRDSFPDAQAAKVYVANYLGARAIVQAMQQDHDCYSALMAVEQILGIHEFFIKLHPVTGERQPDDDVDLLNRLRSKNSSEKVLAILEFIYSVRCNMMHGQKDFSTRQLKLLCPTIILLRKLCTLLHRKLSMH